MIRLTAKDVVAKAGVSVRTMTTADAAAITGAPDKIFVDVRETNELMIAATIASAIHVQRFPFEFLANPSTPNHKAELNLAERLVVSVEGGYPALKAAEAPGVSLAPTLATENTLP